MFCNNCGNNLDDGARFCDKCGWPIDKGYDNNNITDIVVYEGESSSEKIKDIVIGTFRELLSIIKSPINNIKELKNKDNSHYIGIAIISLIITVINCILLKNIMFRGIAGKYIESLLSKVLSITTTSIIISTLILNVVVVALSICVLFLLVNKIFKNHEFSLGDSLKTIITGYVYSRIIMVIASLLGCVSMQCTTVVMMIAAISNIIIVFSALNENNYEAGSKNLYSIIIIYIIIGVIYWIFINIQVISIMSTLNDIYNSGSIYNSLF